MSTRERIYRCDVHALFIEGVPPKRVRRWLERDAQDVQPGQTIRCYRCHGAARMHRNRVVHGPADHVEHRRKVDSQFCELGYYFSGEHRMSDRPVLDETWRPE